METMDITDIKQFYKYISFCTGIYLQGKYKVKGYSRVNNFSTINTDIQARNDTTIKSFSL